MDINYRSIADLNNAILKNLHLIPHDIDLIVGIPRSGMLPANLIALYLNKPYTDVDALAKERVYGHGNRIVNIGTEIKSILLVDDSIATGRSLLEAKDKVLSFNSPIDIKTFAVYVTEDGQSLVDIFCELLPFPRFFQWNVFHHPSYIPNSCFDIDGVLCDNPPIDDDGPLYVDFISNAPPKYIPTYTIDTIVSCRLEKYRSITEDWLRRNNVKFKKLILLDLPTRAERLRWGRHGEFKGQVYKESKNRLFVESSLIEAKQIVKVSRKSVFCTESFTLLNWESYAPFMERLWHRIHVYLWKAKLICTRSFHDAFHKKTV